MRSTVRRCVIAFALVFGAATLAEAQLLYSVFGTNVVSIDPLTGTQVARGPALIAHLGIHAIDLVGRRLFYEATAGSASVLSIFDLNTNTTTQVPLASSFGFMAFDPVTGRIYGVQGFQVVSVDPASGISTVLATSPSNPYL